MTAKVIKKSQRVNLIVATCERCGRFRSRKDSFAEADGERFVCAKCVDELSRHAKRDLERAAEIIGGAA